MDAARAAQAEAEEQMRLVEAARADLETRLNDATREADALRAGLEQARLSRQETQSALDGAQGTISALKHTLAEVRAEAAQQRERAVLAETDVKELTARLQPDGTGDEPAEAPANGNEGS